MKLGLHLSNFTYGVPAAELAAKLTEIVVGGEAAGFDRLSVMDHYFQIPRERGQGIGRVVQAIRRRVGA